jgi:dienelactone hydrolase
MLKLFIIIGCLCLAGCATNTTPVSPESRAEQATRLAKTAGWKEQTIQTSSFVLKAYGPRIQRNVALLTIYIEGDGLAWKANDMPSDNPTPMVPTGLKMAIHDQKNHPVVYLARPCQFVFDEEWGHCQSTYWTNLRFSPEVVNAMNQAVSDLKKYYHAKKIRLIGYSGGGTIAALIAARHNDTVELITVAAILDVKEWVNQKSLTPLYGSLDPADEWGKLVSIPQTHWVGGNDTVVPKEVAFAFANRFPSANKPEIKVIPSFDHVCCWATWSREGQAFS